MIDAKASIRGMQIGVRDIRLSNAAEGLQSSMKYLGDRQASATKFIEPHIAKAELPENRERLQKLRSLVDQYAAGAKEIAAVKTETFALDRQRTEATAAATDARIQALNQQAATIAREKTLPIAAEMEDLANKVGAIAKDLAAKEKALAEEAMHNAEMTSLTLGAIVVLVLIGSAVFGAMAIARPLRKIAEVLGHLTQDRIVEVPYITRGDEIGDIAKATDVFKDSIAEKVTNMRVKTALDIITSNVMMADENYNISYMNDTMKAMMRTAESELRKALPQFDSSKLIGANIDIFHKNPAHQRRMLEGLSSTFQTDIAIGNQKFHLIATPVIDKHSKRIGTVVEWRNETVEKAIEEEVANMVAAAAAGDFSMRIPVDGKTGFMLTLTNSMNSLCGTISTVLTDLVGMLSAMSGGDLTKRIDADYQGTFGQLKDDANGMADKLTEIVSQIKGGAGEVANAAAEISAGTTDLSQRTEEQAASLEETSASMEEISATVKKNAENAQQANQSAAGTREVASRGGDVVAQAVDAMSRIEESSRKIADIISVIDEIARQTNLLALNAAVEAARAGDAGRGFAVVASEVRSLAQRSSQAAKDIKDLIGSSTMQVKDGVDLVNRAGEQLKEIVESIKGVATIVSEIANASIEQATGIEQVNKALAQMDEVTQQNSALVEENAASAKTLEQQAAGMNERVGFFRFNDGGGQRSIAFGGSGQQAGGVCTTCRCASAQAGGQVQRRQRP